MPIERIQSSPTIGPEPLLDSVTVVITTFNDEAFLSQALASVMAQQHPAAEVIVVDDGSEAAPTSLVRSFAGVKLITKTNGGLASARNVGLRASHSRYISFLDADDLLSTEALLSGLACFHKYPNSAMVYGGHRRIHTDGSPISGPIYHTAGHDAYASLLTGNMIGMHATVLYRCDVLLQMGGFNEHLRRCEDYDLYLRLAREHSIASHPNMVAQYRWHGQNMSRDTRQMLRAVLCVHEQHRPASGPRLEAWIEGQHQWRKWYTFQQANDWGNSDMDGMRRTRPRVLQAAARRVKRRLRGTAVGRVLTRFHKGWPPRFGSVDFGSFSSTVPASNDFGWDRGTPIDRYYVERFLAANAPAIQGRVLEIGDDSYSKQYGCDRIVTQDVLHVDPQHPTATLKGSLLEAGVIPENAFDCVIFTQTLQLIFELQVAVERLHAALKPGGVLLLTVPGISQIDRQQWRDDWCWAFTITSIRRLFSTYFQAQNLNIDTHGNVFAATSFLFGLATEEVDAKKLDETDPAYPCIITLRATKRP